MQEAILKGERAFLDRGRLYLLWYVNPNDSVQTKNELKETLREGAELVRKSQEHLDKSTKQPNSRKSSHLENLKSSPIGKRNWKGDNEVASEVKAAHAKND